VKASLDRNAPPDFGRLNFECASPNAAIELVERLDGRIHTELSFDSNGWCLIVGGGPVLEVAVKFDTSGNSFAYTNPAVQSADKIDLCVGGQLGDYEPIVVCPLTLIAEAIWEFLL
jgi:hypothetical protein